MSMSGQMVLSSLCKELDQLSFFGVMLSKYPFSISMMNVDAVLLLIKESFFLA